MPTYQLNVNGQPLTANVDATTPLLWVLRDHLGMTGTKYGCGISACGACTVHVDGVAARSCVLPISQLHDRAVVTIEAMSDDPIGRVVQQSWFDVDVVQCGYCQSGQIMNAVALLKMSRKPTDAEIEASMGGSICRCGTYVRIRDAVRAASRQLA
jgi:isoquinoline 1-oxidoreductase subunit alpha